MRRNERRRQLARLRANPGGKRTAPIPAGMFCYTQEGWEEGPDGDLSMVGTRCPYWGARRDKSEMECGYCSLLGLGDWMPGGTSDLWDQVKACGIKPRFEDEPPAPRPRFAVRRAEEARNGGPPLRTPRKRRFSDRRREWEEAWWSWSRELREWREREVEGEPLSIEAEG